MQSVAKIFIVLGLVFLVVGGLIYLAIKLNLPFGRLPGDIRIEGKNYTFYFPLATSILLSILLTVILNIIGKFLNK